MLIAIDAGGVAKLADRYFLAHCARRSPTSFNMGAGHQGYVRTIRWSNLAAHADERTEPGTSERGAFRCHFLVLAKLVDSQR